tara:strand:- start:3404 stop:3619 length:216 start_codon:yes stop_codon:yes gene_type:complete
MVEFFRLYLAGWAEIAGKFLDGWERRLSPGRAARSPRSLPTFVRGRAGFARAKRNPPSVAIGSLRGQPQPV